MSTSTKTQQAIAQKMREIEELRNNGLTQDIIDVLQNKKHTREELYAVCKEFTKEYEKAGRQENLKKARAERAQKQAPAPQTA